MKWIACFLMISMCFVVMGCVQANPLEELGFPPGPPQVLFVQKNAATPTQTTCGVKKELAIVDFIPTLDTFVSGVSIKVTAVDIQAASKGAKAYHFVRNLVLYDKMNMDKPLTSIKQLRLNDSVWFNGMHWLLAEWNTKSLALYADVWDFQGVMIIEFYSINTFVINSKSASARLQVHELPLIYELVIF